MIEVKNTDTQQVMRITDARKEAEANNLPYECPECNLGVLVWDSGESGDILRCPVCEYHRVRSAHGMPARYRLVNDK